MMTKEIEIGRLTNFETATDGSGIKVVTDGSGIKVVVDDVAGLGSFFR